MAELDLVHISDEIEVFKAIECGITDNRIFINDDKCIHDYLVYGRSLSGPSWLVSIDNSSRIELIKRRTTHQHLFGTDVIMSVLGITAWSADTYPAV